MSSPETFNDFFFVQGLPNQGLPGVYSWKFLVEVCHSVLQILTLFQTKKKCHFPHPFSDLASLLINITCT